MNARASLMTRNTYFTSLCTKLTIACKFYDFGCIYLETKPYCELQWYKYNSMSSYLEGKVRYAIKHFVMQLTGLLSSGFEDKFEC